MQPRVATARVLRGVRERALLPVVLAVRRAPLHLRSPGTDGELFSILLTNRVAPLPCIKRFPYQRALLQVTYILTRARRRYKRVYALLLNMR